MSLFQNYVGSFNGNFGQFENQPTIMENPYSVYTYDQMAYQQYVDYRNSLDRVESTNGQFCDQPQSVHRHSGQQFKVKQFNALNVLAAEKEKAPIIYPSLENKRIRNMFSIKQIEILEKVFEQTHYPDISIREELSKKLNLKPIRIQVWFQNRRAKYRKNDLKGVASKNYSTS